MSITASMVKELRELTGVAMMDCKKALVETNGDIEAAIKLLREKGMAKAAKKADLTAAEGAVLIKISADGKTASMVEVNSQTDFVALDQNFKQFADNVINQALKIKANEVETLLNSNAGVASIDELRKELIVKIGENINVRRVVTLETDGMFGSYIHSGRIGVLVDMKAGDLETAKDIAMHIAASRPQFIHQGEVDPALVEKEKEIFSVQAKESGKPAEIIEKMVQGRISKFVDEVSLLGQPFIKDPNIKIEKLLKDRKAVVHHFVCFEVGEGIEKKEVNFRDEVMAQVKGAA